MAAANQPPADQSPLAESLRRARLTEAAHYDAALGLRDAKSLRLQILKDEIAPVLAASAEAKGLFDLTLIASDDPRLWIDLVTAVVMEPDPKTYRLIRDSQNGRETLAESGDRAVILEAVKLHIAHQIVARQRQLAPPAIPPAPQDGYSPRTIIFALVGGFATGALTLLFLLIILKNIHFN